MFRLLSTTINISHSKVCGVSMDRHINCGIITKKDLLTTADILSIEEVDHNDDVYDLEIQGNHNYFANNLSAHNCHKLVLEGLFGAVNKVITTKDLMDQKHIADFKIKCLLLKHSDIACKAATKYTYQQEIEYLVLNEARNKFISNLAISLESNTLVLYQYVEKHGTILHSMINSKVKDRKVFFIHGSVNVDVREEIRKIVETETNAIIVASYGTTSTGINIRNLHNVIFASPSKSRIRNLQSIGRSLRKSETKTNATLYDIADDLRHKKKENYTLNHFTSRIQIYSEEKFTFKIYKIDLKEG